MIKDWQIQHRDKEFILGLSIGQAVLDVVSDNETLAACVEMLKAPHKGFVSRTMGCFGEYPVRLNLHYDDSVSIFIDGPDFDERRCQSSAIWVEKEELQNILQKVLDGEVN